MDADITTLYDSSFYRVIDFRCKCIHRSTSQPEFQEGFSITYVRKGNFIFKVFRNAFDAFNGYFLVNKPDHQQIVSHYDNRPDQCTIFSFHNSFYELIKDEYAKSKNRFFDDNDIHSVMIRASAESEYLHTSIINAIRLNSFSKILIDTMNY